SGLDGVTAVVVLGIDAPGGRSLGAVVQCEEGLTVAALRAKIASVLPPWSWPQDLQLVLSLPRLPSGRPDRQACARLLTEAAHRGGTARSGSTRSANSPPASWGPRECSPARAPTRRSVKAGYGSTPWDCSS